MIAFRDEKHASLPLYLQRHRERSQLVGISGVGSRTDLAPHCAVTWPPLRFFWILYIKPDVYNNSLQLFMIHCIKVYSAVLFTEVQYYIKRCATDNRHLSIKL